MPFHHPVCVRWCELEVKRPRNCCEDRHFNPWAAPSNPANFVKSPYSSWYCWNPQNFDKFQPLQHGVVEGWSSTSVFWEDDSGYVLKDGDCSDTTPADDSVLFDLDGRGAYDDWQPLRFYHNEPRPRATPNLFTVGPEHEQDTISAIPSEAWTRNFLPPRYFSWDFARQDTGVPQGTCAVVGRLSIIFALAFYCTPVDSIPDMMERAFRPNHKNTVWNAEDASVQDSAATKYARRGMLVEVGHEDSNCPECRTGRRPWREDFNEWEKGNLGAMLTVSAPPPLPYEPYY